MDLPDQFDIIRPYYDHEVKPAIERLLNYPNFEGVLKYLFGDVDREELMSSFRNIETIKQFQVFFSYYTVKTIVEKTSNGLTQTGREELDTSSPYLFVANHRDIVLDAAIMQYLLSKGGHKTSQITFGENLMTEQFLLDLGKLNKMFTFYRGGSKITQYRNAKINSAYINHVLKEQKESIWIAQRNGRTKDGNDRTQTGLIKMLVMGGGDICESLAGLNIVPVAISYEIEPCDIQKTRELYLSQKNTYVKSPNEDFMSIMAGITGDKGRIHFSFGTPLNKFLDELKTRKLDNNEIIEEITKEIDRQIFLGFKCWPASYIAADLIEESTRFAQYYSKEDKTGFEAGMRAKTGSLEGMDQEELQTIYLQMYAGPVFRKIHP